MRGLLANLRRRPHGPAELVADGLRVLAVASIVLAGLGWGGKGVSSFAVVSVAMLLPRALGVRPALDITYGVIALAATWSSVTDFYSVVWWLDDVMHFAMTGIAAATCYILFVRFGAMADSATLRRSRFSYAVVTTTIGAGLAALWEIFEWFTTTFIDPATVLTYEDTVSDMVFGTLGSLLAGLLMPVLAAQPRDRDLRPESSPDGVSAP
ncbi:hypothetical protein BCL57_000039 [Agromyces flavus]|uniref:Uncharacterized protein n=1 Tax=Agromyces flavus TaxID=589382 RepID=A0A1H1VC49_9MICO|nr:hypothetical protein [Agromyces flavus]MCP2365897.1 hypothetical protein [Agromyces flavus]GGI43599.1 hypothetical protein GCM10010932_00400 [Agromyces flavus]SDS82324.1 hypothetical protein SAMN04489721_1971 [Agromyces flavus]